MALKNPRLFMAPDAHTHKRGISSFLLLRALSTVTKWPTRLTASAFSVLMHNYVFLKLAR